MEFGGRILEYELVCTSKQEYRVHLQLSHLLNLNPRLLIKLSRLLVYLFTRLLIFNLKTSKPHLMIPPRDGIFERLLLLPLFQGLSVDELMRVIECSKFNFDTQEASSIIIEQGKPLTHLIFVLQGDIRFERNDDEGIQYIEYFNSPMLLLPNCLFGKSAVASHTVRAENEITLLEISKHDVIHKLMNFFVFRLSLLNTLCTATEKLRYPSPTTMDLSKRIVWNLLKEFHQPQAGRKEVHINMQQLADRLHVSRLSISKCLRDMQQKSLIQLHRERIILPQIEQLL